MKNLYEAGSNYELKDDEGRSPLHYIAYYGKLDDVQVENKPKNFFLSYF
jgi:hypothetical protein